MLPKYRFWHAAEKKMYKVLCIHLMSGMVEVEGGKCFLILQDGFLMKFTSLFDKNGDEIFEGDVVEIPSAGIIAAKVVYTRGIFSFDGDRFPLSNYDDVTVLGNIYEHLHLL